MMKLNTIPAIRTARPTPRAFFRSRVKRPTMTPTTNARMSANQIINTSQWTGNSNGENPIAHPHGLSGVSHDFSRIYEKFPLFPNLCTIGSSFMPSYNYPIHYSGRVNPHEWLHHRHHPQLCRIVLGRSHHNARAEQPQLDDDRGGDHGFRYRSSPKHGRRW